MPFISGDPARSRVAAKGDHGAKRIACSGLAGHVCAPSRYSESRWTAFPAWGSRGQGASVV